MTGKAIEVDTSVFFLWCILLLVAPLNWLFAAVLAAVVHELFHAVAIYLTGGSICHLRIGVLGAVMEADIPGRGKELFCAIAGPCGSFLLLLLCHSAPRVALCGLIQGAYNLLPIYPLDGGRALFCILLTSCPVHAERVRTAVEFIAATALIAISFFAVLKWSLGLIPVFAVGFLLAKMRLRKRPCKQRKIRVQ